MLRILTGLKNNSNMKVIAMATRSIHYLETKDYFAAIDVPCPFLEALPCFVVIVVAAVFFIP